MRPTDGRLSRWRIRITERGVLDEYTVGRVGGVDNFDNEIDAFEGEGDTDGHAQADGARKRVPSNAELMAVGQEFLEKLTEGTPWVGQQLNAEYVPSPRDVEQFSFWMAMVSLVLFNSYYSAAQHVSQILPISEHEKEKLLPIRSARLRLQLVVHWSEQLRSNW